MNWTIFVAQLFQAGAPSQLLEDGASWFLGVLGLGALWLLRKVPEMARKQPEFSAKLTALSADVEGIRSEMSKSLDKIRTEFMGELREANKQLSALASDSRLREHTGNEIEKRQDDFEARLRRVEANQGKLP